MNPEISIIVPVYNVEKYLGKCIESILTQTFKNFELILINDGSTDRSLEILNEYCKKDRRIIVIDKKNSGSSDTRNIGIDTSNGKYICFVDSDDWIEYKMIDETYKIIVENNSDMIISGIRIDTIDEFGGITTNINNYEFSNWSTVESISNNIINIFPQALINSSCNKLYNAQIVKKNNIKFINTNIGEDTIFNLEVLKNIKSLIITDKSYYHYMRYANNITLTNRVIEDAYERYIVIHDKMKKLFKFWGNYDSSIEEKINITMFSQYLATSLKILNANNKLYPYNMKKNLLNKGLRNKEIINTFSSCKPVSYKEWIFRWSIKKRMYLLTLLLLKISK